MKLELSRQIFEKYSKIKFKENPSSGCRVMSWGEWAGVQMARHEEANIRFSQFF